MNVSLPPDAPRPAASGDAVLASRGRMSVGLLFRLAVADLWHERALTACVIVALTAVLAPLLILFSLKYGLVETLRTRLVNDPRNREIRPEAGHSFTYAQVQTFRGHPGIRFVIPNTRSISSSVDISLTEDGKNSVDADLLPTDAGDPLLEENGAPIPGPGECVLSHRAWKALSSEGAEVTAVHVRIGRTTGKDRSEHVSAPLQVVGVAQERATDHVIIFTRLEFLEQVETWRDGRAVPSLNWPGGNAEAAGVTDRVIVSMPRALDEVERSGISVSVPWISELSELPLEEAEAKLFPSPPDGTHFYEMAVSSKRHEPGVDSQSILALRRSLPQDAGGIYAQCRPLALDIVSAQGAVTKRVEFQVAPLLVNQPTRRALPSPASAAPPVSATVTIPPAPPAVPVPPPVAAAEVPKAIPVSPQPEIVLPPAAAPSPVPFDFQKFENQLKPAPPPPPARPAPPAQGQERDTPPSKSKSDRNTGGVSTALAAPPARDFGRYVQAKKQAAGAPKTAAPKTATAPPPKPKAAKGPTAPPAPVPLSPAAVPPPAPVQPPSAIPPPPSSAPAAAPPGIPPSPRTLLQHKAPEPLPPVKPERVLLLPPNQGFENGAAVVASFASPFGLITFPATIRHSSDGLAKIPQSLAGVLRLGLDRGIAYEQGSSEFVLSRRGYPALRIVAHTIDDVEGIAEHFGAMHIGVMTAASRIRDLKELDRYTSYVFLLIAVVGLTGAAGSLLASLIAAVERKRRSLGVLRLLGLRRRTLFRLPVYQSAMVVTLSVGLAVLAWRYITRAIIQITTASDYLNGESIQVLPSSYLWAAWGGALAVACAASIIAGMRVMRVDPSEAIRDE